MQKLTIFFVACFLILTNNILADEGDISSGSSSSEAQSVQTSNGLEEIVVTARKREENLLNIPETVVAISGETITQHNMKTLDKIGMTVPNFNLNTRTDGWPNVTMRGLGAFSLTQGVGFYLDDIQLFGDATSRFGDLDRIEILKGPQGVLYGGSNIGGAIKFISTRPSPDETSGRIKLMVGEQNSTDIEGSINLPIGNDWAVRLFAFSLIASLGSSAVTFNARLANFIVK